MPIFFCQGKAYRVLSGETDISYAIKRIWPCCIHLNFVAPSDRGRELKAQFKAVALTYPIPLHQFYRLGPARELV